MNQQKFNSFTHQKFAPYDTIMAFYAYTMYRNSMKGYHLYFLSGIIMTNMQLQFKYNAYCTNVLEAYSLHLLVLIFLQHQCY